MAYVNIDLLATLLTGSIGDEITVYKRGNKLIVARKRRASKKKPTAKQIAVRKRMAKAVEYAKEAMEDTQLKAYYEKKAGDGQNAFNMAVSDYLTNDAVKVIRPAKRPRLIRKERASFRERKPLKGPVMVMNLPTPKDLDG